MKLVERLEKINVFKSSSQFKESFLDSLNQSEGKDYSLPLMVTIIVVASIFVFSSSMLYKNNLTKQTINESIGSVNNNINYSADEDFPIDSRKTQIINNVPVNEDSF